MKENLLERWGTLFIAVITAYLFSYYLHLNWISWASENPQFFWKNELMINNVDGYFYGSGAQKILYNLHSDNPRLLNVWSYGTAVITAYLTKLLPISLDTAMLYLPPIISSLVVIPIILIGRLYGNLLWGFLSALIGAIGWSYYNRTLAGYYDTDMFSAMLPMFILYFLLSSVHKKSLNLLLIASLIVIAYPWLYEQALSIIYAVGIVAFLYLLFYFPKEKFTYKFIILFSFALLPIHWLVKLILVGVLWYLLKNYSTELKKLQIAAGISALLFLFMGNVFGIILHKVFSYTTTSNQIAGLNFLNVNETVREAGKIPFVIVANRIIGSLIGVVIAVIGYLLLVKRYKEFIIALPLWGIGLFAYWGGLRFTVYAVPIAAMSAVYLFFWLGERLKGKVRKVELIVPILGSLFILAPNISHIKGCCEKVKWLDSISSIYPIKSYPYLTPTTFYNQEVKILDKLRKISSPKDYVITWWDYGYPIWYYANVNTLIDGGKHNEDNFLVSKILTTSNQTLAYNLSKLSIKTYVETNRTVAPQLFIKDGKPIDVNLFLQKLGKDKKEIGLKRDIYLMLPYRMLGIFPTVAMFSQRDLNSGEIYKNEGFFYQGKVRQQGNFILIGGLIIDPTQGTIKIGKNIIPIKKFVVVTFDTKGETHANTQTGHPQGVNIIINQSDGKGIVVDDYFYNSLFFQLYFFDNYDPNLFEPVIKNPWIKVYKLK